MGKGDIKTKKGKMFKGSYGKSRPKKVDSTYVPSEKEKKKTATKKAVSPVKPKVKKTNSTEKVVKAKKTTASNKKEDKPKKESSKTKD